MKKYHIFRTCLFFILLTIVAAEGSGNNESNGEKTTGSDTTKTKIERLEEKVKDIGAGLPNLTLKWDERPERPIDPVNPNCEEIVCRPEFWVPENKLCLYCGYRG